MLKTGDILIAIKPCIMTGGINEGRPALIVGKEYPVTDTTEDAFWIHSEISEDHQFESIEEFFRIKNDLVVQDNYPRLEVAVLDYSAPRICRFILTEVRHKKIVEELMIGNYVPDQDEVIRHFIETDHEIGIYDYLAAPSMPMHIETGNGTIS
jgi:hypothetical protein